MDITERRISRIARGASRFVSRILRQNGVGSSEVELVILVRFHPGITQSEACQRLELDKGAAARLVARLESKGYLRREMDPEDKRIRLLYTTEKADELRGSKARLEEFFYQWLLEPLSEGEKQELVRMLAILGKRAHEEWHNDFAELNRLWEESGEEEQP